jgi:hypothetical protein
MRMVVGFFVGVALGLLSFGLAWVRWWPHSMDAFINMLVLFGAVVLITGAAYSAMYSLRPIGRWWLGIPTVALGAVGGGVASHWYLSAVAVDCLRGTDPQEDWCHAGFSSVPLLAAGSLAGAFVGLVAGVMGMRARRFA